jgi:NitT/TauT family transport system substrate-binding protein
MAGKVVIFLVIAAIVLGGTYFLGGFDSAKNLFAKKTQPAATGQADTISKKDPKAINISLDEWIGWKSVIDANGGLTTKPGSIYDKLGIKVNISVVNEADKSSAALIKGDLDGAGYTVNRYAFLYPKFVENKVPVTMPYITNSSTGGDGIVAKKEIARVEDLVGKKVAVPRFSEAQTLVEWLLAKSDLTADQKKKIQFVYFDDHEQAAKAFFGGQVDAAATWQPFLSQAAENPGTHILFSTKSATNVILDGIVFRKDYLDSHKEQVQKLIEGSLMAQELYTKEFTAIKNTMPQFAGETNESIKGMTEDATLADQPTNLKLLSGLAQTLFIDMSNIWKGLGEKAMPQDSAKAFDASLIQALSGKFDKATTIAPKFTEEQRQTAKGSQALLTKKATIQFQVNSDEFVNKEQAYAALGEFINIAKIMDGTVIQIEGNTSSEGDAALNKELSYKRARAISTYLKYQGIDPTRFVVVGNGPDKPVADNGSDAGREANRRTEIFFKVVNQ